MINNFYYPKKEKEGLIKLINNWKNNEKLIERYYHPINIKLFKDNQQVEYAEVMIPMIGTIYIKEMSTIYTELRYHTLQNDEKEVLNVLDKLLEELKEHINVLDLYKSMIQYAQTQSENAKVSMKWEMQQKFRELIGIED